MKWYYLIQNGKGYVGHKYEVKPSKASKLIKFVHSSLKIFIFFDSLRSPCNFNISFIQKLSSFNHTCGLRYQRSKNMWTRTILPFPSLHVPSTYTPPLIYSSLFTIKSIRVNSLYVVSIIKNNNNKFIIKFKKLIIIIKNKLSTHYQ